MLESVPSWILDTPTTTPIADFQDNTPNMDDLASSGGWRFAQCFGDKGDVEDITEGQSVNRLFH